MIGDHQCFPSRQVESCSFYGRHKCCALLSEWMWNEPIRGFCAASPAPAPAPSPLPRPPLLPPPLLSVCTKKGIGCCTLNDASVIDICLSTGGLFAVCRTLWVVRYAVFWAICYVNIIGPVRSFLSDMICKHYRPGRSDTTSEHWGKYQCKRTFTGYVTHHMWELFFWITVWIKPKCTGTEKAGEGVSIMDPDFHTDIKATSQGIQCWDTVKIKRTDRRRFRTHILMHTLTPVSYTHLTLPTKLSV